MVSLRTDTNTIIQSFFLYDLYIKCKLFYHSAFLKQLHFPKDKTIVDIKGKKKIKAPHRHVYPFVHEVIHLCLLCKPLNPSVSEICDKTMTYSLKQFEFLKSL